MFVENVLLSVYVLFLGCYVSLVHTQWAWNPLGMCLIWKFYPLGLVNSNTWLGTLLWGLKECRHGKLHAQRQPLQCCRHSFGEREKFSREKFFPNFLFIYPFNISSLILYLNNLLYTGPDFSAFKFRTISGGSFELKCLAQGPFINSCLPPNSARVSHHLPYPLSHPGSQKWSELHFLL